MLLERFERLNALARLNFAKSYLEIGVANGSTFHLVEVPYKVGVDPKFQFNVCEHASQRTIFHETTSDVFFSTLASRHGKFDLIYLDGLHTFDQTFRDFCSSIKRSHANTIWLIDDTLPTSWWAANRSQRVARGIRRLLRRKDPSWMGDVFKVVFAIHDFFPQFNYLTFPGHGQTVVWLETRKKFAPRWNSLGKISRFGYRDFQKFRDLMLIAEAPSILDSVRTSMLRRTASKI